MTTTAGVPRAAAQSVDQCIATKAAEGVARPEAIAACIAKDKPATTVAPATRLPGPARQSGDGGVSTSTVVLGVGVGAVGGAGAIALLGRRRRRRDEAVRTTGASNTPFASGSVLPAPVLAAATTATSDRSHALIDVLIDLSDRVPSSALRNEILVALDRAGVRALEVAPGNRFDTTSMRGVGSIHTADPSTIGLVVSTERIGFADGTRIVRLPDVTVQRAD